MLPIGLRTSILIVWSLSSITKGQHLLLLYIMYANSVDSRDKDRGMNVLKAHTITRQAEFNYHIRLTSIALIRISLSIERRRLYRSMSFNASNDLWPLLCQIFHACIKMKKLLRLNKSFKNIVNGNTYPALLKMSVEITEEKSYVNFPDFNV